MEDLIIKYLTEGKTQAEIPALIKSEGIKPNSLRHIDGEIKKIKQKYGAKTMFHLGVILTKNI